MLPRQAGVSFDCQRSQFHNTPPTNLENIWLKTYETPILGSDGVTQDVMNITGGTNYTLNAQALFEAGYSQSGETVQMGLIWEDGGGTAVGTPAASISTPLRILQPWCGTLTRSAAWLRSTPLR